VCAGVPQTRKVNGQGMPLGALAIVFAIFSLCSARWQVAGSGPLCETQLTAGRLALMALPLGLPGLREGKAFLPTELLRVRALLDC
jgi:hypothetical protein